MMDTSLISPWCHIGINFYFASEPFFWATESQILVLSVKVPSQAEFQMPPQRNFRNLFANAGLSPTQILSNVQHTAWSQC